MKHYAIYYYTGKFLSQQICLIKKEKKKKKVLHYVTLTQDKSYNKQPSKHKQNSSHDKKQKHQNALTRINVEIRDLTRQYI